MNISSPQEMSVHEIAEIIEIFGRESELVIEPLPEGASKQLCPEVTRARETSRWGCSPRSARV